MTMHEALEEIDRVNEQLAWHARHMSIVRVEVLDQLMLRKQAAHLILAEHVA